MVEPFELHIGVSRVDLQLEVTFTFRASIFRAANDGEAIGVADLRVKLNLRAQRFEVGDTSLRDDVVLLDPSQELALLT